MLTTVDDHEFPRRLVARLAQGLPGRAVQQAFAPELSYGRHFGPPAFDARAAAVAVLLYERAGVWHMPLTVRPSTMVHHAGQISLPGGQVESGETSSDAAIRELHEELGIALDSVDVLGQLSPVYVYASNFLVTPWLVVERRYAEFQPNRDEVSELIELPIAALCDPKNRGTHVLNRRGIAIEVPHIARHGHHIWGATCLILGELAALCDAASSTASP
ncbi:MAG TPA: CoA pyrophosphatase [Pirellulales bacterium]|nr:CoA pyrophosphatase [Pirellulales bacterium]